MAKIPNRDVTECIRLHENFTTHNETMHGVAYPHGEYAVFSYSTCIAFWEPVERQWYLRGDRCSPTTNRHMGYVRGVGLGKVREVSQHMLNILWTKGLDTYTAELLRNPEAGVIDR